MKSHQGKVRNDQTTGRAVFVSEEEDIFGLDISMSAPVSASMLTAQLKRPGMVLMNF
jgi:hypothetical protein